LQIVDENSPMKSIAQRDLMTTKAANVGMWADRNVLNKNDYSMKPFFNYFRKAIVKLSKIN
jgi:hypothetical protein